MSELETTSSEMLWKAVECVATYTQQIASMVVLLDQKITERVSTNNTYKIEEGDENEFWVPSEWLLVNYRWQYSLTPRGKGRKKPEGWLYFQIIIGENSDYTAPTLRGEKITLLCVGYSRGGDQWEKDSSVPPLFLYGSSAEAKKEGDFKLEYNDRLLRYRYREDNQATLTDFYFVVPLLKINSPVDLDNHVVNPILSLLKNNNMENIFGDNSIALALKDENGKFVFQE